VSEGFADFRGHQTWYRVTGPQDTGKAPLVVLHGGPGCTHDYLDSFMDIAGRPVIHYDQLGNGRSTRLRDRGADFWTVELFVAELDNLLAHLGIAGRYHVLGQSWGRTFAAIDEDPTVYHTMNGPSEFHVVGPLKDWSIIDRLDRVAAPTLLISGRYDEATPATVQPYADRIPDVRWQVFEQSSHMPHVEEKDACLAAVAAFIDQHD
jgi:L-proline amide hydrolase